MSSACLPSRVPPLSRVIWACLDQRRGPSPLPPEGRSSRQFTIVVSLSPRFGRHRVGPDVHGQALGLLWIKQPRKQGVSLKLKLFNALGDAE
jgi:hypothetical protein